EFIDRFWGDSTPTRPVKVGEGELEKAQDLWATETGQVWTSLGGTTVFDINRQRAGEWLLGMHRRVEAQDIRRFLDRHSTVLPIGARITGSANRGEQAIEKIVIESEPGILTPGLAFLPKGRGRHPAVLFLDDRGKAAEAGPGGELEQLAARGCLALAIDVRGVGETAPQEEKRGDAGARGRPDPDRIYRDFFFNPSVNLARGAMNLGRPLLGMRVHDALAALHYLATRLDVD